MAAVFLGGRSPSPVFEGRQFAVKVSSPFGWAELSDVLKRYSADIKDQWLDPAAIPPQILAFCAEIERWLADPVSQDMGAHKALDFWVRKVKDMNLNTDWDILEIKIVPQ